MNKFLDLMLGTSDVPTYAAAFVFALFGLAFHYRSQVKKRDKESENTPSKFSLSFFLKDNIVSIVFNLLGIFLLLRFSVEYGGVNLTMFYALGIGYAVPLGISKLFKIQDKAR